MTDITTIARECGARDAVTINGELLWLNISPDELTAFADRIRAEALEEAAKKCEEYENEPQADSSQWVHGHCAAAIRSLSKTPATSGEG